MGVRVPSAARWVLGCIFFYILGSSDVNPYPIGPKFYG